MTAPALSTALPAIAARSPASLPHWLRRAVNYANTPRGGVMLLIATTLGARLLFAAALGLGVDESYMVAAGRHLQFGYFDHPPLAWWLAWGASHLFGTDSAFAVRLPFVFLFALSTWLMWRLGTALLGECAGLWGAVLLNAAPVFGLTTASWVLPDGPLVAALLGFALCLAHALNLPAPRADGPVWAARWGWWLGAGVCLGLAMLSKYTAILTAAGAVLYLLADPVARRWLARPQPYAAMALALSLFAPVIVWNAHHHWASFMFQAGRAGAGRLHPFGPLTTLGGEILFLLPWIGVPLLICLWRALRGGPGDPARFLPACLALPPILLFLIVSLHSRVLFHWAAPGYLMLFPLLGAYVGSRSHSRPLQATLVATAALVVLGAALAGSEVRYNWLPAVGEHFALGADPDIGAVDWNSLRQDLAARGLLTRPGLTLAATRWSDAGKIDYAVGGAMTVTVLGDDPREYGIESPLAAYAGQDLLIVAPKDSLAAVRSLYGRHFDAIDALPPAMLRHNGRPAMALPLYLAHDLHRG